MEQQSFDPNMMLSGLAQFDAAAANSAVMLKDNFNAQLTEISAELS